MTRRRTQGYFKRSDSDPAPLRVSVKRRVAFREVDAVAIVWHGRYASYFEDAATELRRACGLTYVDFRDAGLRAPIVQFHVDHHGPLLLDEEITVGASLIWSEAARLNTEYEVRKSGGAVAATGYSVQMLVEAATGEPCLSPPPLLRRCHERWRRGEFSCLQ